MSDEFQRSHDAAMKREAELAQLKQEAENDARSGNDRTGTGRDPEAQQLYRATYTANTKK